MKINKKTATYFYDFLKTRNKSIANQFFLMHAEDIIEDPRLMTREDKLENELTKYNLILNSVSFFTKIPVETFKERSRKREIIEARHLVAVIALFNTNLSICEIGRKLCIDHATVLHAKSKYCGKLESNDFVALVNDFVTKFNYKTCKH